MGKKRFAQIGAIAASAVSLMVTGSALASAPLPASGTETYVSNFTVEKAADGNVFLRGLNPGVKTGTFTGTQAADFTLVLFKDGTFNFEGVLTFIGTVEGCGTGTVVFRAEGAGFLLPDETAVITRDHQQTLFGRGTLPVHARLDVSGTGTTLAYSGEYHC